MPPGRGNRCVTPPTTRSHFSEFYVSCMTGIFWISKQDQLLTYMRKKKWKVSFQYLLLTTLITASYKIGYVNEKNCDLFNPDYFCTKKDQTLCLMDSLSPLLYNNYSLITKTNLYCIVAGKCLWRSERKHAVSGYVSDLWWGWEHQWERWYNKYVVDLHLTLLKQGFFYVWKPATSTASLHQWAVSQTIMRYCGTS